jgi:hypothetical protein
MSMLTGRLTGAAAQVAVLRERLQPGIAPKLLEQLDRVVDELREIGKLLREELA